MPVMVDTMCAKCDRQYVDAWSDELPVCCGEETRRVFTTIHTTEWGGPRTYLHLRDEPFHSRSELNAWAKSQGMALGASAEKHGGARNEEHMHLGKIYSYHKGERLRG